MRKYQATLYKQVDTMSGFNSIDEILEEYSVEGEINDCRVFFTEEGIVLVGSYEDENYEENPMYELTKKHVGHRLKVESYDDKVALIECLDCNTILYAESNQSELSLVDNLTNYCYRFLKSHKRHNIECVNYGN